MNNKQSGYYSFPFWILFIIFFFTTLNISAQTGTVSVEFKNASPKEIIENLESRTPYRFIYQDNINLDSPKVTLTKENVSIDEILKDLQELTGLNFRRNENNIAINKSDTDSKKKRTQGISGKIVDNYGLPLFDAVVIANPGGVTVFTDSEGGFILELDPGFYNVEVTIQGFNSRYIQNIPVSKGEVTPLNLGMELADNQNISLDEIVLTGEQYKSAESTEGLLLQQKRAAQMSDGISAGQIARTPDSNVGSTLKRITGVTTVDDRYVVVRSMGERWNQAMMDGVNLPSTEVTQQSFSFDIIPTAMVQSIVVSKTATPDMYANFAGGNIEVKTKDIPKEDFTTVSISNSYNNRSTFKDFLTKQRGKYDFFGFDDGTRSYPDFQSYPYPSNEAESGPYFQESKKFTQDNFATYKDKAIPNTSFQFALGRVYNLDENSKWGFSGSLLFRNTQSKQVIDNTSRGLLPNTEFYPEGNTYSYGGGSITLEYPVLHKYGYKNSGGIYTYNSTLAGMLNGGVQFGSNKITMRNTLIHIYDNQLTQITGWNSYQVSYNEILNGSVLPQTKEDDYPVYTDFFQNKVEGNHRFNGYELNWFTAINSTVKKTKDATFLTNNRERVGDDILVYTEVYNSASNVRRANFDNDETDYNIAFNINKSFDFNQVKNNLKIGYFGTFKTATNQQEKADLRVVGQGTDRVKVYDLGEVLSGAYYYYGGFGWTKLATYGNRYKGEVITHSPFIMLDNRIGDFLRIVWGLRAESYDYNEISNQREALDDAVATELDEELWQYLPSVNITYSPTRKSNIRLGYYKSALRPQFSERLQIPYYDPVYAATIINYTARGGIISSISNNYDLKFEWFPSLGQILSAGVYYKKIDHPIEKISSSPYDSATRYIYTTNSERAELWGIEAEILKNLSFLGEGKTLQNIYLYANGTINETSVTSYVNIDGTGGLYEANRPLYGQSPYSYNLGLDYVGDRLSFNLRYNGTGDQYLLVGFDYADEEIRRPYAVADAQISYRFLKEKNFEVKISAQNIFDRVLETYNNKNSYSSVDFQQGENPRDQYQLGMGATKRYDEDVDRIVFRSFTGRNIKFTLTYNF